MTSTLWLTGLSGAGKSTLARTVAQALESRGLACVVLDGDELRTGLCNDLGFSAADRSENIRRTAEVAALLNRAGVIAIAAMLSPMAADRARAREIIGNAAMLEVHVATPLEVCESRDPKGLYQRARRGDLPWFTGISAPYEVPLKPQLTLDTSVLQPVACLSFILALLKI
jgi:adenylylsulfate kinase